MNQLIEQIFAKFNIDGVNIPVHFLRYKGKEETYITYQNVDTNGVFSGDDEILAYVEYYDIDIYSKHNYFKIVERVKELMKANGFMFQPSMTSEDLFEDETGYFHKTLCFAKEREE